MTTTESGPGVESESGSPPEDPVALSRAYVRAIRTGDDHGRFERALATLDPERLYRLDDPARRAVWINVYNGAVQAALEADPDRYDDRRQFFGSEVVTVAGHDLSPDAIEHGILRRSRVSWGLGYLKRPRLLVGEFERYARVLTVDPRIHFALNCGAAACPPVAAYGRDVEAELAAAARSYLGSEVDHDPGAGVARVPRLLLWFRGDFGGREGIYRLLWAYGPVAEGVRPRVRYRSYDWSLDLGNFREPD